MHCIYRRLFKQGQIILFFLLSLGTLNCHTVSIASHSVSEDQKDHLQNPFALLEKVQEGLALPSPQFPLIDAGLNVPLDYTQYGEFENLGTADYRYILKNTRRMVWHCRPGQQ